MEALTFQQKRMNLRYALHQMWPRIPVDRVSTDLCKWRSNHAECGTVHCFGGHLVHDPYFQSLGVEGWIGGVPVMVVKTAGVEHRIEEYEIGRHLFGYAPLMFPRGLCPTDRPNITDHEIVRLRLRYALDILT